MNDFLENGRAAAASGDWVGAFASLAEADARGLVGPEDLPLLADVAYAAGHLDTTITAWERAYAAAVQGGDQLAAAGAAARLAMHLLFDTALMAPVRGWLARADRLLAGKPPTAVHAWFAVVRSYERLLSGDVAKASSYACQAIECGTRFDAAAAAIGRVASARCLILDGNVQDGLAALEEAGVAMLAGELDPLSTGVVYCELVCALQSLAHYDLAEEWTRAMEAWARTHSIGSLHGRCRVHRAEILRLRGSCDEAEHEALAACEELRPYLRRELGWPLTELGRIRLQRGDLAGAEEAFLAAHESGWDPQPGLALLHLAQGERELASTAIRAALDHPSTVPSKEQPPNTDLRRAPLLQAEVTIALASSDPTRAGRAAVELAQIAARFATKALIAGATLARGQVELATHDGAARKTLEQAAQLWHDVGAPYETALARIALADAQRAAGDHQLAELELRAAHATLARIGASPTDIGVTPSRTSDDVFRRDGDIWCLAFAGRSVRLHDLKGLHYIARLLAEPGREYHVLELVKLESGGTLRPDIGDAGPLLDGRAKDAYRRRLTEIEEDIADARTMNDLGRLEQAAAEREFLLRELSRAIGLGGRVRRAGSSAERARVSVTRAVRQAIARIREHHSTLADHLDNAVRTGSHCSYVAEPAVMWQLV